MDDYYDDGNPYASPKPLEEPAPAFLAERRWCGFLFVLGLLRIALSLYLALILLVADYTPELWARLTARLPYMFAFYWIVAVLLPIGVAHHVFRSLERISVARKSTLMRDIKRRDSGAPAGRPYEQFYRQPSNTENVVNLSIAWISTAGAFIWTGIVFLSIVMNFSFRSDGEGLVILFAGLDIILSFVGLLGIWANADAALREKLKDAGE